MKIPCGTIARCSMRIGRSVVGKVAAMSRAAAVSAAAMAMPSLTLAQAEKKKIPIGLELYSVRVELPKDFTGVIEKIGKMGYVGVEFAGYHGWDKKPNELKKLLDDNGL